MWWAGWAEAFIDNAIRARDTHALVDANPLGTAAGYGVNLPLDREHTTAALGFARMQISPIYAQLSRGKFELAALEALGGATLDLRRIAWDLSLFTSAEFGFVALPAQYTTGSSIMPNKRNPDVIELMRATHASVAAARTEIEQLLSLPSGYHRDLQSSKGAIFHGFGRGLAALELLPALLANLEWRDDRLRAAIDSGMYATDVAVEAAVAGVPFREAYKAAAAGADSAGQGRTRKAAWPRACRRARPPTCAWTNCARAGRRCPDGGHRLPGAGDAPAGLQRCSGAAAPRFPRCVAGTGQAAADRWLRRWQRWRLCAVQRGQPGAGAGHRRHRSAGDDAGLRADRARMEHPLRA
jgi:argininosuccinate lyase